MSTQRYLDQLRALIAAHGHAIQAVMGDANEYPFAYTVGRSQRELLEVVVVGLPTDLSGTVLNGVCDRLAAAHGALPPVVDDVVNVPLRLRRVDLAPGAHPLFMLEHLGLPPPRCVIQVMWPCPLGFFPDEKGYSHRCEQDLAQITRP